MVNLGKRDRDQSTAYLAASATVAAWSIAEEIQGQRRPWAIALRSVGLVLTLSVAIVQAIEDLHEGNAKSATARDARRGPRTLEELLEESAQRATAARKG